jgi:hypothetical protein
VPTAQCSTFLLSQTALISNRNSASCWRENFFSLSPVYRLPQVNCSAISQISQEFLSAYKATPFFPPRTLNFSLPTTNNQTTAISFDFLFAIPICLLHCQRVLL